MLLVPAKSTLAACAFFAALLVASGAFAMEIAGVKLEPKVKVGANELTLNGAGIRKRVIVNVYVGALYLQEKKTASADAVNLPGAKRMHLQMLREISGQQLVDAMKDAIKNNTPQAELDKMAADLTEFYAQAVGVGAMKAGDYFTLDYVPGTGLVSALSGKPVGKPIANADMYKAIMRIFIGDKPVDDGLKKGMLGG